MSTTAINLSGQRFGRLIAIRDSGQRRDAKVVWFCMCDCGNEALASGRLLRDGRSRSCGCLRREVANRLHITHGKRYTRTYKTWLTIKNRCLNPRASDFPYYGGRGITVCAAWREDFLAFLADMGERPPGLTIDRLDNDGDYEPGNCRWATMAEQNTNKRRRAA